jgi:Fe-S oxidoreductase
MNPGKIVAPTKMDDRTLFRFKPGYSTLPIKSGLDWSGYEVGDENWNRGFAAAIEMCNNNGHCRKFDAGTMCPSYRVTRNERDLTRGRANSLRLAMSGQLGPDALFSDDMYRTMELCVSCKGCKRECPTGVDMAAMKIEFLYQYHQRHPRTIKDKLVAHLPRYAPILARIPKLANLRNQIPGLATLSETVTGLSAGRSLPVWRRDRFLGQVEVADGATGPEVVLLADTFNTYFEPENLRAAVTVFAAANYQTIVATPVDGGRPLCCGRTYLATGMIDEARAEAQRMLAALKPFVERGVPVVGLEPSCLLGLRDEFSLLVPGEESAALAELALTFEEFLVREQAVGRLQLKLDPLPQKRALVHGHCHQKAFDVMHDVNDVLNMIPELEVETIQSGCCGMAGAFGYEAKHAGISREMAELSLLPAVRGAGENTVIVADGTSCRHQIRDFADRKALHVARLLAEALAGC